MICFRHSQRLRLPAEDFEDAEVVEYGIRLDPVALPDQPQLALGVAPLEQADQRTLVQVFVLRHVSAPPVRERPDRPGPGRWGRPGGSSRCVPAGSAVAGSSAARIRCCGPSMPPALTPVVVARRSGTP